MWQAMRIFDEIAYMTAKQGYFTAGELARSVGMSETTAWRRITELLKAGQIHWLRKGQYAPLGNAIFFQALMSQYREGVK